MRVLFRVERPSTLSLRPAKIGDSYRAQDRLHAKHQELDDEPSRHGLPSSSFPVASDLLATSVANNIYCNLLSIAPETSSSSSSSNSFRSWKLCTTHITIINIVVVVVVHAVRSSSSPNVTNTIDDGTFHDRSIVIFHSIQQQ